MSAVAERVLHELDEEIAAGTLFLPTLPEVALRVREVVDDEDAGIADIVAVVGTDAALSARLVQVANSPLYRRGQPADSVQAAVSRLGMKLVRDMVVSMAMEQMFQATNDSTDRMLRDVWEHSLQVAAISHVLAAQYTELDAEQAMLAGLVHDLGVLPVLAKAEEDPELLEDEVGLGRVVREIHPRVGGAILRHWNFPEDLVAVAAEHEHLGRDTPAVDYVDVVMVANLQSRIGTSHPLTQLNWERVPAFAKLGIDSEVNVVEMDQTAGDIREVHSLLSR